MDYNMMAKEDEDVDITGVTTVDEDVIPMTEVSKNRHISELNEDERVFIKRHVETLLKESGIRRDKFSRRGRARSSSRSGRTSKNININGKQLSNYIADSELGESGVRVTIPYWLQETCRFISQEQTIKLQGLFRKEGAFKRKNEIVNRFKESPNVVLSENESPHDITSSLKQLLRDMPDPLIPVEDHSLLLKCLTSFENLMSVICLMPVPNINSLSYLMQFLKNVSKNSDRNQMGSSNLAKVFTPNIMPPPESKKNNKDISDADRKLIESHIKVVEILIENGDEVGFLSPKLEKFLEDRINFTFSEDELDENGKNRKRRSGSVTRMMDIIKKKVGLHKTNETPSERVFQTPSNFNSMLHTPIIDGSMRRRNKELQLQSKLKTAGCIETEQAKEAKEKFLKGNLNQTPDFFLNFSSASYSMNPSPDIGKHDWKTPVASKKSRFDLKHLTPKSFMIKRNKLGSGVQPSKLALSAPAPKNSKMKVFGRKAGKKQVLLMQQIQNSLKESKQPSVVSLKSIGKSPVPSFSLSTSTSNSKIPRPETSTSSSSLRKGRSATKLHQQQQEEYSMMKNDELNYTDGEYVTILPKRRNVNHEDSFIASPWDKIAKMETFGNKNRKSSPSVKLHNLTPLIKEIDDLTLKAQNTSTPISNSATPPPPLPPKSARKNTPKVKTDVEKVEDEFRRTVKETRIIEIRGEQIKRRHTTREKAAISSKGLSPCQRKVRRRSHEIKPAFKISPLSPRSKVTKAKARLSTSPLKPVVLEYLSSPFGKSTLRRGRPNSIRAGLPLPSPMKVLPPHEQNKNQENTDSTASDDGNEINGNKNRIHLSSPENYIVDVQTQTSHEDSVDSGSSKRTVRRMSSVQELVQKLESRKSESPLKNSPGGGGANKIETRSANSSAKKSTPSPLIQETVLPPEQLKKATATTTTSSHHVFIAPTPTPQRNKVKTAGIKAIIKMDTSEFENDWVPASKFDFNQHLRNNLLGKSSKNCISINLNNNNNERDRESIQVIKSLNAGKVSANVKLFNNLNCRRSPRSQIPRYIGGENQNNGLDGGKKKEVTNSAEKPKINKEFEMQQQNKMMRRFSSVDVQRGKHEMLLDNIKRDAKVKRSATLSQNSKVLIGTTYVFQRKINVKDIGQQQQPEQQLRGERIFGGNNAVNLARRESVAPFAKPPRTKRPRTGNQSSPVPSIMEEENCDSAQDQSLVKSEKDKSSSSMVLRKNSSRRKRDGNNEYFKDKSDWKVNRCGGTTGTSDNNNIRMSSPAVKRSVSERSTSSTTPNLYTPKIKKHLTIGCNDQFKNSPNKTPRHLRYPLRRCQDNFDTPSPSVSKTPMKAIHFEFLEKKFPRNK